MLSVIEVCPDIGKGTPDDDTPKVAQMAGSRAKAADAHAGSGKESAKSARRAGMGKMEALHGGGSAPG